MAKTSYAVNLSAPDQMLLFGSGRGTDLPKLRRRLESLEGRPRAASTNKGYAADWKSFAAWCDDNDLSYLPASELTVALYTTSILDEGGKKVSTALHHLAAIADAHRRANLTVPPMSMARAAAGKIRRSRLEQPERKTAMSVDNLVSVALGCDDSDPRGARDRAIIVLGFATALRRSELCRLEDTDLTFTDSGLDVFIRHSKTDQEGVGRHLGVRPGKRDITDPVKVLKTWIQKRGNWAGPLFCRVQTGDVITHTGLTGNAIAKIIKAAAARAGLEPSVYAGHSLRAGFVTAAVDLGRNELEIAKVTGHTTTSMMRVYFRSNGVFLGRNPLEGVL